MSQEHMQTIVTLGHRAELCLGNDNNIYVMQRNTGNVIKSVIMLGPNTDDNIEGLKGCLDRIHQHGG